MHVSADSIIPNSIHQGARNLTNLNLISNPQAHDALTNSTVITGLARSGTTIVGRLVGSLKKVEYFFEPPQFIPIMLSEFKHNWEKKLLLESYFYNDLLLSALAGRGLNTNYSDDSSIYSMKAEEEIEKRLKVSLGRKDLISMAQEAKLVFKTPAATHLVCEFFQLFPRSKVIYIHRRPSEVIASLVQKGWFANPDASTSPLWPLRRSSCNRVVPWWLEDGDTEIYFESTELDRCALYYITHMRAMLGLEPLLMNYDDLIEKPDRFVQKICEINGLEFGALTKRIIQSVGRRSSGNAINVIEKLSSLTKQVEKYEVRCLTELPLI